MKRYPFKFTPLKEFKWHREDTDFLVGHYLPGMTYNCTTEPRHDALFLQCVDWEAEGKIRVLPLTGTQTFKTVKVEEAEHDSSV